jgi:hypothetical protein
MNDNLVVQSDNRLDLEYVSLTRKVNKKKCIQINYDYKFIDIDTYSNKTKSPFFRKLYLVNDILNSKDYKNIVFLDSDAWIQNEVWLQKIIKYLSYLPFKHGCFSRDPYMACNWINKQNTYINSGSFILKNNDYTRKMYKEIIINYENSKLIDWPYDQFFVSNFVLENSKEFIIFKPDVINTGRGVVIRHNWYKDKKMYNDLRLILNNKTSIEGKNFNIEELLDKKPYPNVGNTYDYKYSYPGFLLRKIFKHIMNITTL